MSNDEKPEFRALRELEDVANRIAEELTTFRLRAQKAEAARAEADAERDFVGTRAQIVELEAENRELRARIDEASGRVGQLLARLRFLEEQMSAGAGT